MFIGRGVLSVGDTTFININIEDHFGFETHTYINKEKRKTWHVSSSEGLYYLPW